MLELGRWAPNHHVTNPWRFRVLGPAALERLKHAAGPQDAGKLDRAPTLVAVSVVQSGGPVADEEDPYAAARAAYSPARPARPRAGGLLAHARGAAHR
jgi:hypothetical protein